MNLLISAVTLLVVLALGYSAFAEWRYSRRETDPHVGTFNVLRGILSIQLAFFIAGVGYALAQFFR